jgi:hypothetical protein
MWRTHHDALDHGLAADEKHILATFKSGEELERHKVTEELAPISHCLIR